MDETRIGFRDSTGLIKITSEDLIADIVAVANEELDFWSNRKVLLREGDPAGRERVNSYLRHLWDGTIPFHGMSKTVRFDPVKHPWSAVFVCYCISKAFEGRYGQVTDRNQFRRREPLLRGQAHIQYVRHAVRKRNETRRGLAGGTGFYWAFDMGVSLRPGDIVVKDRVKLKPGEESLALQDVSANGWRETHGDIVTRIEGGRAHVVGGNVQDSVPEQSYPLTDDGRVDRSKLDNGANRTFTVLRLMPEVEYVATSGESYFRPDEELLVSFAEEDAVVAKRAACDSGREVVFSSLQRLCVVTTEKTASKDDKHFDAFADFKGLEEAPLLDIRGKGTVRLSKHFTVAELAKSDRDYARIDPKLVAGLEMLRTQLNRPVRVVSGYRSWEYNKDMYSRMPDPETGKPQTPKKSPHTRGIAADVQVAGMSGLDLAKRILDAFGVGIGIGIGMPNNSVHVDVRGTWSIWAYSHKIKAVRDKNMADRDALILYRRGKVKGAK